MRLDGRLIESWRVCHRGGRIHCFRLAGSDIFPTSAIRPASAETPVPRSSTTCCPVACPVTIRACASLALSYESSSSNHRPIRVAPASKRSMRRHRRRLPGLVHQTVAAARSAQIFVDAEETECPFRPRRREPGHRRQGQRWRCCTAIIWKFRERGASYCNPSAHSALPWLSSEPCGSSQRRTGSLMWLWKRLVW